ncbi:hypothetical protein BFS35_011005 [Macrococcoides goetzii]|uniref:Uncharacterized protein n=2 Tax=Macrococcoides goetzii TaxID=1891097 RepID=A0A364JLU1_9STAP|nr:hypothetical protein BFS35_011005 [Macrococcus goetzii]
MPLFFYFGQDKNKNKTIKRKEEIKMTESIKVLNFGKKVELVESVNELGETVKEEKVVDYGKDIAARGTFWFSKIAKEKFGSKDSNSATDTFFSNLYTGLIMMDESKLVEFWVCATAYLRDKAPTEDEIMDKLQEVADVKGMKPLFKGALEVLEYSGFFKDKVAQSWDMMQKGARIEAKKEMKKVETQQEKDEIMEESMEQMTMMVDMKNEILEINQEATV